MNEIQLFKDERFGEVRVAGTSEEPLFCLADVCKAIGIANPRNVKDRLEEEDVRHVDTLTAGGIQQVNYVTESGLYDVIIRSDSENAKPFRKWVTSEVLPSIRKSGGYIATKEDDTPEMIMARAILVANETITRQKKQIEEAKRQIEQKDEKIAQDAPKVLFADAVSTSKRSCLVAELAKILQQNGVNIGQNRLFDWMRKNGYLCSKGQYYNQPTQRAQEMGLFEMKQTTINKPDGSILVSTTTKVTGRGQIYFLNKFIKTA